jgi:hypothetical protein
MLSLAAMLPLLAACDFGIVYVDPPGVERGHGGLIIEGEPHVELGIYHEQLYEPFGDSSACPIVHGLQGGTWTHPAIRIQGIAPQAVVDCTLKTTASGELVGAAKAVSQFFVTPEGQFEVHSYPIPIVHTDRDEGPGIEDLFGQKATLSCSVSDDQERHSQASVTVELIEG